MSAEEFWAQHAQSALNKSMANNAVKRQEVGVSGSFLGDIKPQADGANGLKYNLTPDVIESIFKTYPAVKRKHQDHVPVKMSESEFWTKFFQSHYFHRDRVHGHGVKDIFTECAKDDDKTIKAQLQVGVNDKVANLAEFSDSTIHENYGGGLETPSGSKIGGTASNIVHQNIIKRFNQHSIMVMKATEPPVPSAATDSAATVSSENNKASEKTKDSASSSNGVAAGESSRKRLRDKVTYEDLEAPAEKKMAVLNLTKVERYLNGPTLASSTDYLNREEIQKSRATLQSLLTPFETGTSLYTLTSDKAVNALIDLSPGGSLMQASRQEAIIAEQCPESVQAELKQLYGSLCELSRHFWGCFPPTTPQLKEKTGKMYDTLKKFQQVKLRPFENELARAYSSMSSPLTNHINQMLEAIFRKYATWKQKKIPSIK